MKDGGIAGLFRGCWLDMTLDIGWMTQECCPLRMLTDIEPCNESGALGREPLLYVYLQMPQRGNQFKMVSKFIHAFLFGQHNMTCG